MALAVASASGQLAAQAPVPATALVRIETERGAMTAEIYIEAAPVTAGNFMMYVDAEILDGGSFFRTVRPDNQPDDSVKIGVIQGGPDRSVRDRLRPPIPLERTSTTGLTHGHGVLSMARSGPDTGRAQFFVCIGDQPALDFGGARNADGQGFAVFGRVIDGMDVAEAIQNGSADGQRLVPEVRITSIRRIGG